MNSYVNNQDVKDTVLMILTATFSLTDSFLITTRGVSILKISLMPVSI